MHFIGRLNIDISPDGQQLVFDMLGDIYLLPVQGGAATPLRTGPAFETQVRHCLYCVEPHQNIGKILS